MATNTPFIRRAELLIGPLADDEGGGPSSQAVRILSNGDRNSIRVRFRVEKTITGAPNVAIIDLYNLARNTLERLRRTLTRVRFRVGWENTDLTLLASGGLLSAVTTRQGPDLVTRLSFFDGYGGIVKGVTERVFAPGQDLNSVIRALAEDMPGVTPGTIEVTGRIGLGGYAVLDRTADTLNDLAEQYGFSWSVQNGALQALQDTRSLNRIVRIRADDRTLITATPTLTGAMQLETGAEIEAVLDARAVPGVQVDLQTNTNPSLNGIHKVYTVSYDGDTNDASWFMSLQSFRFLNP